MKNLVFLPATEPDDTTYGEIPDSIPEYPQFDIRTVAYPRLVWYNDAVQREAIIQIRSWNVSDLILVGFSKSGLGAWNIARRIPDLVSGTIIFDSPVTRESLPTWGTQTFYSNDIEWQRDLPIRTIDQFHEAMQESHKLVLISGPGFHNEMVQLSEVLNKIEHGHTFLDRKDTEHHWNSGWIEEGLKVLL